MREQRQVLKVKSWMLMLTTMQLWFLKGTPGNRPAHLFHISTRISPIIQQCIHCDPEKRHHVIF